MAISLESFLVLEKSLTKKILTNVKATLKPKLLEIFKLIESHDYADAEYQLRLIEFELKDSAYLKTIGLAATMFGASRITADVKASTPIIHTDAYKSNLETITTHSTSTLNTLILAAVVSPVAQLITSRAESRTDESFRRNTMTDIATKVNNSVVITNSLHVSRMATYGYLLEAVYKGVTTYKISAQLDTHTCPVCDALDGKTFNVYDGLHKVENLFAASSPDIVKELYPFPKQTKGGVADLKSMNTESLVRSGFQTPPFHPRCRCVLVTS